MPTRHTAKPASPFAPANDLPERTLTSGGQPGDAADPQAWRHYRRGEWHPYVPGPADDWLRKRIAEQP